MTEVAWQCWVTFIKIGPYCVHVWIKGYSSYLRVIQIMLLKNYFLAILVTTTTTTTITITKRKRRKGKPSELLLIFNLFQSLFLSIAWIISQWSFFVDSILSALLRKTYLFWFEPVYFQPVKPLVVKWKPREVASPVFLMSQKIKVSLLYATLL